MNPLITQIPNNTDYIDGHILQQWFANSHDVIVETNLYGDPPAIVPIVLVYCTGMTETRNINDIILPDLQRIYNQTKFSRKEDIVRAAEVTLTPVEPYMKGFDRHLISARIFEGHLLLCFPSLQTMWTIDIANLPARSPSESTSEVSILGPKDGFVEMLTHNVALIRKRLRSPMLTCQYHVIGTRTMTKVALLYVEDIADPTIIKYIHKKISATKIESLNYMNQMEEIITSKSSQIFPLTNYTGRPDFAVDCLLNGRFIIIVDGNPSVIIAPVNLFLLLKSPEDAYFSYFGVNVGRLLRMLGLLLTIFLPGFYIALTAFHPDQIPFPLLSTISTGRAGLPMESGLEMFFIMILMELFREAGVRLPSPIGQTLTVVGGLIIGDAAIRAGLVSPLMIVVTATTIVAGSTLVNQILNSSLLLLRLVSFLFAVVLGMYGFILSIILFVIYTSSLESFGVPYLAPLAPLNIKGAFHSLFKVPFQWNKKRPSYLHTQKPRKQPRKE
ncbi:MAG: spore germination protein [Candidatus Pristimantibacillus sp.]